jgi:tetratricopeptide (TPR) repeat protein
MSRSQCYYDLKLFTDCIKDLNTALQIDENNSRVLYLLGLAYYAFEKYKKCIKTLKAALQNRPFASYEADIYYHIGLAYCNQEKFEKSIYPFSVVSICE